MPVQCIHDVTVSHALPISLFLVGLMGGFTHCAGMCSPFVLAQTGTDKPALKRIGSYLLLPYHFGRMTTYVMLAVLSNAFIGALFISSEIKSLISAPLLLLAAIFFLASAFPRLRALFPWAHGMKWSFPYRLYNRLLKEKAGFKGVLQRYGLGVLLGFLPCGLVVSAVLASAAAPDILGAAVAMTAFTFGTMPALFIVAFGGQAIKYKFPYATKRLSQGAMVISSLWLIVLAGTMIL